VEGVDNNLISHCRNRSPEDLMGYIDVEIISSDGMATINNPFEPAAVAMCNCMPAPEVYGVMMASQIQVVEEAKVEESNSFLEDCQQLVASFTDEANRKVNIMGSMD